MNCWEFKKCGREKNCPAYPEHGTQCARVAGTLCGGKVQGIFALKLSSCLQCDFYQSPHYHARENAAVKENVSVNPCASCQGEAFSKPER